MLVTVRAVQGLPIMGHKAVYGYEARGVGAKPEPSRPPAAAISPRDLVRKARAGSKQRQNQRYLAAVEGVKNSGHCRVTTPITAYVKGMAAGILMNLLTIFLEYSTMATEGSTNGW